MFFTSFCNSRANPARASWSRASLLIIVFYGLAVMLNLKTVTWVLNNVITIGFMAAVVIFQPELRRTLERMGQSTMWANRLFGNRRSDPSLRGAWQSAVWPSATRRSSCPTRAPVP